MKTILLLVLFLSSSLFIREMGIACQSADSAFTLNIANLDIDTNKLKNLCTQQTCAAKGGSIIIRSHYDKRVGVIIGSSFLGYRGVSIKLPYAIKEDLDLAVKTEIAPEEYNWSASVAKDLNFLKTKGVLIISDSDIETISKLAKNDTNILNCENKWKAAGSPCNCSVCLRCQAPAFTTSLPNDLLE